MTTPDESVAEEDLFLVRDWCDCESYDCVGECCGVGNCTCTTTEEAR